MMPTCEQRPSDSSQEASYLKTEIDLQITATCQPRPEYFVTMGDLCSQVSAQCYICSTTTSSP